MLTYCKLQHWHPITPCTLIVSVQLTLFSLIQFFTVSLSGSNRCVNLVHFSKHVKLCSLPAAPPMPASFALIRQILAVQTTTWYIWKKNHFGDWLKKIRCTGPDSSFLNSDVRAPSQNCSMKRLWSCSVQKKLYTCVVTNPLKCSLTHQLVVCFGCWLVLFLCVQVSVFQFQLLSTIPSCQCVKLPHVAVVGDDRLCLSLT